MGGEDVKMPKNVPNLLKLAFYFNTECAIVTPGLLYRVLTHLVLISSDWFPSSCGETGTRASCPSIHQ